MTPPVRDREQARELVADSLRDWVAGVVGGFDTGTIQEQADRIVDALLPQPDPEDSQRDLELCIAQGGHFWPASELSEDAPDDEPPTCTRCGYNPGWKPGSVDAKAPLGQSDPEVERVLVEAVAEVLWNENWRWQRRQGESSPYPYDRLIEVTKDDLRDYARSVIDALRTVLSSHPEPTLEEK